MEKRWHILEADAEKVAALQDQLKISATLCKILVQRGLADFDLSKNYFRPQLNEMHSPWLMKDMDKAVARILFAFEQKEKILVYGDYDVDGTTSVACMFRFLKSQYEHVAFYIPHRYREGYGVSKLGIEWAKENGFTLIVSLDCGIKSVDLITYAKSLAIDFIVCDHHLPDDELPPAIAILNAKQMDCTYPYKELCGCGVGYKLITALCEALSLPEDYPYQYLDLVATAIAADIVPMTGENRLLAYYGLQKANQNPNPGIKALVQLNKIQKELHINTLVFVIAPRVNAAGRMDDAKKAVQMFVEDDETLVMEFAEMLHSDNSERKEADSSITEEALAMIEADANLMNRKSTVVFKAHWHKGVVGIVASRLIEKYYRPTVVLTQSGEYLAGSARSVVGFNLYEAIHACREYLLGYGGHFAAAGLTLLPENFDAFSAAFEKVVTEQILPEQLVPVIVVDAVIQLEEINAKFFNIIKQMEPFGPENLRPMFLARGVVDSGYSKIVKEEHIRFVVKQGSTTITGIGFGLAHKFEIVTSKKPFDLVFTLSENEWMGETNLQLMVTDLRVSESN
jgi:single-stranded-DNA-specific exonuclease